MELPHLQLITQGGGKMDEKIIPHLCRLCREKWEKIYRHLWTDRRYGPNAVYLPAHLASSKICSIGRAIPNGELSLVDEQGKLILEKEATGQLVYKRDPMSR